MPDLTFEPVDERAFDDIPDPAEPGARCQTCDYWEHIDGGRAAPDAEASDTGARAALKRRRLLAGQGVSGSYGMLAYRTDAVERMPVGYAQFGPLSAYPRAQVIRDRYPQLPESPSPWVITCLQVSPGEDRAGAGTALLEAVCADLDRRGIIAVEAYPERAADAWLPSAGPASVYEAAGFARAAGDDRFPVYRRELTGETDAEAWSGLLRASQPDDEGDDWPLPLPPQRDPDDLFRLPAEKPKRPNPFGDD
jgi:GNAT superfamily N-acetyltransferase